MRNNNNIDLSFLGTGWVGSIDCLTDALGDRQLAQELTLLANAKADDEFVYGSETVDVATFIECVVEGLVRVCAERFDLRSDVLGRVALTRLVDMVNRNTLVNA
jgi:hypothetical protein